MDHLFGDRRDAAAVGDLGDAKRNALVSYGEIGESFEGAGDFADAKDLAENRPGLPQRRSHCRREGPQKIMDISLGSVGFIHH